MVRRSNHDSVGEFSSTVQYYKRPGYYRVDEEGIDASSYVTDGSKVWRVRSGEWTESDYTGILHAASIDDYMLDYRRLGVRYEWAGIHVLNSRPVYHLRRTFADGYRQDLFFSTRTGLLTEIKYSAPLGEGNLGLWRYRDVGGFRLPHVIVRSIGDVAPPHGDVVEEVRINEPLEDGLFHPPEGR